MLKFNTKEYIKYSFEVDGKPYFLPSITLGLFDQIETIQKAEGEQRAITAIEFIRKLAPDARTRAAIETLQVSDIAQLFKEWAGGLEVGESDSSADSR